MCYRLHRYTIHISREHGNNIMAAKKKAPAKKKASASGSDRGAKMKADAAQKKKQDKTASQRPPTAPQAYSSLGDELMSKRESNSRRGDLSGNSGFDLGRMFQRYLDQADRAEKKVAKKAAAKKLETAKKTKRKER
jgi:hypothetical protein